MAALNGAISRRLRGRLPADDVAAINAPIGQPFAEPGATLASPEIPFEQQQAMALSEGLFRGTEQVGLRRSNEYLRGLGGFLGPGGGPAISPQIDATGRPVASQLTFVPGGQFIPGMDERIREVGDAVKRRLQELTGALPGQPQFQSPVFNPLRGRFGT